MLFFGCIFNMFGTNPMPPLPPSTKLPLVKKKLAQDFEYQKTASKASKASQEKVKAERNARQRRDRLIKKYQFMAVTAGMLNYALSLWARFSKLPILYPLYPSYEKKPFQDCIRVMVDSVYPKKCDIEKLYLVSDPAKDFHPYYRPCAIDYQKEAVMEWPPIGLQRHPKNTFVYQKESPDKALKVVIFNEVAFLVNQDNKGIMLRPPHFAPIKEIYWSEDGKYVQTLDHYIWNVWDAETGLLVEKHEGAIACFREVKGCTKYINWADPRKPRPGSLKPESFRCQLQEGDGL